MRKRLPRILAVIAVMPLLVTAQQRATADLVRAQAVPRPVTISRKQGRGSDRAAEP